MLVSILDWIIYIPMILQVRVLKSSLFLRSQSVEVESGRVYMMMAQVAYKYTWTLPWLHGLDNYSLGMNLNWHGHKSGLDKISCSINFAHFSGVKNHFLFSYISHMSWFYILELFSVPKNTLFVSCFRAAYRHLAPRSVVLWAVSPLAGSGLPMHYW